MSVFWQTLRDDSPRAARVRLRIAATAAMAAFLLVLAALVGLLHILLLVGAVALCTTSIVAVAMRAAMPAAHIGAVYASCTRRAAEEPWTPCAAGSWQAAYYSLVSSVLKTKEG